MSKKSIFQPGHDGAHPQVKINPGMTPAHSSSREHIGEHYGLLGLGKQPKPKHGSGVTAIHGGMTRQIDGAPVTGGGSHKSYLDSLSGAVVPSGMFGKAANESTPAWGNSGRKEGNPTNFEAGLLPGSKVTPPARIHPSMSKGADHEQMLRDLGESVLRESFANSMRDDCIAHRRNRDGGK